MVKPIMKDIFFLGQRSDPATKADLQVGRDLMDTLAANREGCVGMAAKYDRCEKTCHYCKYGICRCGNV